jgi:hypothetical protein
MTPDQTDRQRIEREFEQLVIGELDKLANVVDTEIVAVPVSLLRSLLHLWQDTQIYLRVLEEFARQTELDYRNIYILARQAGVALPVPGFGGGGRDDEGPSS